MLFLDLYIHGIKIFNAPSLMLSPVPNYIYNFVYMTKDKKLEGRRFKKELEKPKVLLEIIKSQDTFALNDNLLFDDYSVLLSILPYEIDLKVMDNKERINLIRNMYSYWIKYLRDSYQVMRGSSLDIVFQLAPLILTFKTISELDIGEFDVNDFLTDEDKKFISDRQLKECFSYSVEDLLDKYGIIALLNEKQEENQ